MLKYPIASFVVPYATEDQVEPEPSTSLVHQRFGQTPVNACKIVFLPAAFTFSVLRFSFHPSESGLPDFFRAILNRVLTDLSCCKVGARMLPACLTLRLVTSELIRGSPGGKE